MRVEAKHIGMDGTPCQCTRSGRMRVRRGCALIRPCHAVRHTKCPAAHPCIGGCGRLTTAHETNAGGHCSHRAADRRWIKDA